MEKKLIIFDMDGTLLDTPDKEMGSKMWLEKTGNAWPFSGWWGRKESLDDSIFDIQTIKPTNLSYKFHKNSKNHFLVLMTGRHVGLKKDVNYLLKKHNLTFDLVMLNDGKGLTGTNDTIDVKKRQIKILLDDNYFDEIIIYEDRIEHVKEFEEFFKILKIKYQIVYVCK